ncbi:unnamed protein product [Paramecium sonneborni]|uniref:Uncharacterized protein n=1 Tax=Paramecium sonneborni TaxID=65129 RepID=A0A8S1Q9E2_9CILI|nr:unnamed protein product [Paramecium sonneborni]
MNKKGQCVIQINSLRYVVSMINQNHVQQIQQVCLLILSLKQSTNQIEGQLQNIQENYQLSHHKIWQKYIIDIYQKRLDCKIMKVILQKELFHIQQQM